MEAQPDNLEKDLEEILRSVAESNNIKNYELIYDKNRTNGEGFLSEFFTGEVVNKDNGQTIRVAIKKAPMDGFNAGLGSQAVFKNEIYFYSNVLPVLDEFQNEKQVECPFDNVPRYFCGNFVSDNVFLAMENLKADGYELFDSKKYMDSEHLELIFKTYGKLHALSFSYKQKNFEAYENLTGSLKSLKFTESADVTAITERAFLAALEGFDPIADADILAKLRAVKNCVEMVKSVETYKGSGLCLIHGDCWSNNMLFKYKESGELENLKLVDFQLAHIGTPIHDLSSFFYSAASKKDMDKLDYYLDFYYHSFSTFATELGENPDEMFSLDAFKKEWKQYGIYGIFICGQLWMLKLMDKDEISKVLDQKGLTNDDYWALWDKMISKVLKGPEYKERARNIFLHAVEYGFI